MHYIKRLIQDRELQEFMEKSVFAVNFLKCWLKVKSTLNPAPEREEFVTKTFESSLFVYVNKSLIEENRVNTPSDYISADCLSTSSSSRFFNPFYWKSGVLTSSFLNVFFLERRVLCWRIQITKLPLKVRPWNSLGSLLFFVTILHTETVFYPPN